MGRLLKSWKELGVGDFEVDTGNLMPGIYFYRLARNGVMVKTGKVVVQ